MWMRFRVQRILVCRDSSAMTCRSGVASLLRGFPKAASVASHRLARPAKVGKADKTCNPIQSFNLPRLSPDLLAGGG